MRRPLQVSLLAILSGALCAVAVRAQDPLVDAMLVPQPGEEASRDEIEAWRYAQLERFVRARELAEKVIEHNPRSYVGHFVLGFVQHYAEADFPRALYHHELALRLFERRHGREPALTGPWRWHTRLLIELAITHGDLEHHGDKIAFLRRYNDLYDPDLLAEQAWPLMKLGRFDEARVAARLGLEADDPQETEVALNALCAVEFEAGNDGASYRACRRALEHGRSFPEGPNAVDLTNFSEAARSLFKLDEAERVGLEATEAEIAWYGNPWLELSELYTREARFTEALSALREVPAYRARRPPHVRDVDRNEARRALSAFLLVVGRADAAIEITDKALVTPDRRAHNSRDPSQDLAVVALLDRRARLVEAELLGEQTAARSLWESLPLWARAAQLRFEAWTSGRQCARLLADDARLVGTFRIGTARSGIMPPWLAGDLVEVLGAGVVREAVRRARARDRRPGAASYYDAFDAEAGLASGDGEGALRFAGRALDGLAPAEALLRARVQAVAAAAGGRAAQYESALEIDPGVIRRLGLALPVHIEAGGDEVAEAIVDAVESSPRFDVGDAGLTVRVEADAAQARVCLLGESGSVLACAEEQSLASESPEAFATRVADRFHAAAFAPRIDLSQGDVNSLDGTNTTTRDPLDILNGPLPAP